MCILIAVRITYKYRLDPTPGQSAFLDDQLREACRLYNAALQERRDAWKMARKSIGYYAQANQLKEIRAAGDLGLVNFTCCQQVLRRVDKAFQAIFCRVKRGESAGYPRFRSHRRYDSLDFTYGDGCRLKGSRLHVQGAGDIRVKLHRQLVGTVTMAAVKRIAGRWFVCFSIEKPGEPLPPTGRETGIDVGLTSFAVLADGTEIKNPRHYRKAQGRLRCAQRKVARRKKGSRRRRKAVQLLQRASAHVGNQRADFLHKESRKIVNGYDRIAIEDLNVRGLASGMLAKSVNDAAWAMFRAMITYKAESAGRVVVAVDPRGTSQTCLCGAHAPKGLGDRWHTCPTCGLSAGRDHVSAQLILFRARNAPSGANVAGTACVS